MEPIRFMRSLVAGEWWEIEGRGRWPEEGQIEEFVREQVRRGEGWAIAWALLVVAGAIRGLGGRDEKDTSSKIP
jgi:hypothetical protein